MAKKEKSPSTVSSAPRASARGRAKKGFFPVVAMGASAGGLEALEIFFDNMPPETGMAFVVIQHIARTGKSMLGDILRNHTKMKILEIEEALPVKPDCVYLNPPDKEVDIIEGGFHLTDMVTTRGIRLPIDYFFRSLAEDRREGAICVILSGTGSDGTLGLRAVKEVGGMAIVQEPEQAKYGGMPGSALATGLVDRVLAVERMPEEIMGYVRHPYLKAPRRIETREKEFSGYAQKILALVRSKTGNDFARYKPKTIRRRLERRMALHKIQAIADYYRFLVENSDEVILLFRELLIGVTQFFRDPAAFEVLSQKIIPDILETKNDELPVRIWTPACSTGEEAVSLAILFVEAMERLGKGFEIQIFATDLDDEAIARARRAEYPETIAAHMSEDRLKRFFTRRDNIYIVKSHIREMIVYAVQNLASDPPFSKLDLISCRNVLIYMDTSLQKKIIPLFHFTLNRNGYLFLGSSETTGTFSDLFAPADAKWKIYRVKKGTRGKYAAAEFEMGEVPAHGQFKPEKQKQGKLLLQEAVDRIILDEYAPATVLVNDKHEVLYIRGPANRYLQLPMGEASLNFLKMARSRLAYSIPVAVRKAAKQRAPVVIENVQVTQNGTMLTADVTVRPLLESDAPPDLFVITFQEKWPVEPVRRRRKGASSSEEANPRILELEQDLHATRENLQTTIEELEAANEELRSSNEELQSSNEEIQSTNEELVTAREELQSTNEELVTLNSELQTKVDELTEVNSDIGNLMSSTEIGTIFLDGSLRIKRFTTSMTKLFHLIPSDVGRSLGDITSRITYGGLVEDARSVLQHLQIVGKEVQTVEGSWFSMRILPYRTKDNVIDGVVATFVDISELKRAVQGMRKAKIFAENVVDAVREPLLTLDGDLRIISANASFYRTFETASSETQGNLIYEICNGRWDIPGLRQLLEQVIQTSTPFENFEVRYEMAPLGRRKMILNARRIVVEDGSPGEILLAMEDVAGE